VFTGRNGPLEPRCVADRFRRYRERCGVSRHPSWATAHFWAPVRASGQYITGYGPLSGTGLLTLAVQRTSTLGWSASREHERVVRGRPTLKRRTFRMDGKG
jgi:hypothetical protein